MVAILDFGKWKIAALRNASEWIRKTLKLMQFFIPYFYDLRFCQCPNKRDVRSNFLLHPWMNSCIFWLDLEIACLQFVRLKNSSWIVVKLQSTLIAFWTDFSAHYQWFSNLVPVPKNLFSILTSFPPPCWTGSFVHSPRNIFSLFSHILARITNDP